MTHHPLPRSHFFLEPLVLGLFAVADLPPLDFLPAFDAVSLGALGMVSCLVLRAGAYDVDVVAFLSDLDALERLAFAASRNSCTQFPEAYKKEGNDKEKVELTMH